MKFITEYDLRKMLGSQETVYYTPEPDTKLTPGARQYLADRGVDLHAYEQKSIPVIRGSLTKEICCPSANPRHNAPTVCGDGCGWREKLLAERYDAVAALFDRWNHAAPADPAAKQTGVQFAQLRSRAQDVGIACRVPCSGCAEHKCALCGDLSRLIANGAGENIKALLPYALRELRLLTRLAFEDDPKRGSAARELAGALESIAGSLE